VKVRKTFNDKQYLQSGGLSHKYLRFCEFVADGSTINDAFDNAGFEITEFCSPERVYSSPHVRGQIDRLRRLNEIKAGMTKEELEGYLMTAIRIPVGDVGPLSPFCLEYTVDEIATGGGKGIPIKRTRIKKVSPLDAAKMLIQLKGWAEPSQLVVDSGPNMLAQLEERAKHLVSSLNRAGCVDV